MRHVITLDEARREARRAPGGILRALWQRVVDTIEADDANAVALEREITRLRDGWKDERYANLRVADGLEAKLRTPVPMRLVCPRCGQLHVDEGAFALRAHHTHACQDCGEVWRPAIVCTVGVRFLPGFKD